MFSIEPGLLLKLSFILHRTRANEAESPTYQRLLNPKRLQGITKFINKGGSFPNAIIINFSLKKHELYFEPASRFEDSNSRFGTLKIPNAYAIAYIIDGQHRLYGYANSNFLNTNTIPVVAFDNLDTTDQLHMFIDINENQKAVSANLRQDLSIDLYWNSPYAQFRLMALRASIIRDLSNTASGPLFNKITIAEDIAELSSVNFNKGINDSGLLPIAKGNQYVEDSLISSIYNVNNHNHEKEMDKTNKSMVEFINFCYEFLRENYPSIYNKKNYFIISNRGSYAFIALLGSINKHLTYNGTLNKETNSRDRFLAIQKYIQMLMDSINSLTSDESNNILGKLGEGAETKWLRFFQSLINSKQPEYSPVELIDWQEKQDEQLQDRGRKFGVAIEKIMKKIVLDKIKLLYQENWELEINNIKRECQKTAEIEMERIYKEGLGKKEILWTEMFQINDYKTIIEKYWTKIPEEEKLQVNFKTFNDEFSIDMGEGFNSKAERIKWVSRFNSYRNLWAHEGSKEKRLNKEEVSFLEKIHQYFYNV